MKISVNRVFFVAIAVSSLCFLHAEEPDFKSVFDEPDLFGTEHAMLANREDLDAEFRKRMPPVSVKCTDTGRVAYLETNGKRIVVFSPEGEVEFIMDPAVAGQFPPCLHPERNRTIWKFTFEEKGTIIGFAYNDRSFGRIDLETRKSIFEGRD